MSKHLSYHERCIIERLLNEGKNYAEISKVIDRDKSTVMREVKRNSIVVGVNSYNNTCINFQNCHLQAVRSSMSPLQEYSILPCDLFQ